MFHPGDRSGKTLKNPCQQPYYTAVAGRAHSRADHMCRLQHLGKKRITYVSHYVVCQFQEAFTSGALNQITRNIRRSLRLPNNYVLGNYSSSINQSISPHTILPSDFDPGRLYVVSNAEHIFSETLRFLHCDGGNVSSCSSSLHQNQSSPHVMTGHVKNYLALPWCAGSLDITSSQGGVERRNFDQRLVGSGDQTPFLKKGKGHIMLQLVACIH